MALHSMEINSKGLLGSLTSVHTTSSPHFHQSNGFIEAMVKKVNKAYKKTDGSPNAQARDHYFSYKTLLS